MDYRNINIEVKQEMWKWTVRVNGRFVFESWRELHALRLANRLRAALPLQRGTGELVVITGGGSGGGSVYDFHPRTTDEEQK